MQYTWDDISQHVMACTECPLSRTRHLPVMGRGNRQADIMLIAEAPGGCEDEQGIPFVGRSGEILDRLLRDCGLDRGDQHNKVPSARQPRSRRGGKRSVFSPSEIRDIPFKTQDHCLSWTCGGAAYYIAGFQDHQAARHMGLPEKLCADCDISSFCNFAGTFAL